MGFEFRGGAERRQRGAVLTMTLVFFVVFLVMATAWLGLAVRQSHEAADQEQEEQAFQISEAGIEYVLFLLNGGARTPDDLVGAGSMAQDVTDDSGRVVGSYTLSFSGGGSSLAVTSVGRDTVLTGRCQEIEVNIQSYGGSLGDSRYYVESFDHKVAATCGI